jgi:phosphoesterase RecJ-like protein
VKIPRKLITFLKREERFFIATHINPEGDALGSSLALSMALASLGKKTLLYNKDTVPHGYRFLPGHERFMNTVPPYVQDEWPLVLLDCNSMERAGVDGLRFRRSAVIDHHETESAFGDIRWIEPHAAATGLMIFYVIKALGLPVTREMAVNLYAAIAIDTGTFRYSNTNADVLRVSAELVESGANPAFIASNLYEMWSRKKFHLMTMVLNSLEIKNDIAMTVVSQEMFRKTGTTPEDTEAFPSFPRRIEDITISALFQEIRHNYWKVSLRSRGEANVAAIATHFEGGGHKNAAGYRIKASLKAAKKALIDEVARVPGKN